WRLSGIHRSVYLEAAPATQLFDFGVRTELGEDYENRICNIGSGKPLLSRTSARHMCCVRILNP
ncbi:MAG: hypothetical protein AAF311_06080, partial [Pseudomonadota bacterium]